MNLIFVAWDSSRKDSGFGVWFHCFLLGFCWICTRMENAVERTFSPGGWHSYSFIVMMKYLHWHLQCCVSQFKGWPEGCKFVFIFAVLEQRIKIPWCLQSDSLCQGKFLKVIFPWKCLSFILKSVMNFLYLHYICLRAKWGRGMR